MKFSILCPSSSTICRAVLARSTSNSSHFCLESRISSVLATTPSSNTDRSSSRRAVMAKHVFSSRYLFTPLSQRKVFVRNIRGHVSQSSGYAACCHQCDSKRPLRSRHISSAQSCRRYLNQWVRSAGYILGAFASVPVTCLRGHGSPILSYQAVLRHRSIEKPQEGIPG
ncbi:hypothetical protein BDM02DRAFT_2062494 [Thelephora ganbajun]|uniref:Uncharacterized protein n=1 Tax=Thelephora ganbajun TaxID=370292 RepID=A0ACB6ZHG1_THEGA|nr:hypothetical protein BDM02DRAFT_2062494 [Thelephora ganbajun]